MSITDDDTAAPALPTWPADAWWRVLRRVEATHHLRGWRRPGTGGGMRVYVVYDHKAEPELTGHIERITAGGGNPIRAGGLTATPLLPDRVFHDAAADGVHEPQALGNFAHGLAYTDVMKLPENDEVGRRALPLMRAMLMEPIIAGFMTCFEAYGRYLDNTAEALATARSQRHVGDYPDAREERAALCATVAGDFYRLYRDRDTNTVRQLHHGPEDPPPGRTNTALRLLADLAGRRLPAGQAEHDLRYVSVTDHILEHHHGDVGSGAG